MATAIEDLFKNIASQVQLSSPLGKLLERLARGVGVLASIPSSLVESAVLPDYGWVKRGGSTQVGVQANTNIEFNSEGPQRGIEWVIDRWHLRFGKTYLLRAIGKFTDFTDATNGLIDLKFVDDQNNPLTDATADSPTGRFRPATSTFQETTGDGLEMIYQVPEFNGANFAASIVKLRCVQATGTADVPQNQFTFTVIEIPGGLS